MSRIKMIYRCQYDGSVCDKAIPKFDEEGYLIPESNKELFEKYHNKIADRFLEDGWDICDNCKRNHSMGGVCYGTLDQMYK